MEQAVALGERLLPAFDVGGNALPCTSLNLKTGECAMACDPVLPSLCTPSLVTSLAQAGTLAMEFRALSQASKDPRFEVRAPPQQDKA